MAAAEASQERCGASEQKRSLLVGTAVDGQASGHTCGPAAKIAEYTLLKQTALACRAFAVSHFSRKATMCADNNSSKKKNMYRLCIAFAVKCGRFRLPPNRTCSLSLGSSVRLACRFLMKASRAECSGLASRSSSARVYLQNVQQQPSPLQQQTAQADSCCNGAGYCWTICRCTRRTRAPGKGANGIPYAMRSPAVPSFEQLTHVTTKYVQGDSFVSGGQAKLILSSPHKSAPRLCMRPTIRFLKTKVPTRTQPGPKHRPGVCSPQ